MFWELGTSGTRELGVWEWVWGFLGRCLCGLTLQRQQQIALAAQKFNLSNALYALSLVYQWGKLWERGESQSGILLIVCHHDDDDGCHS